MKPEHRAAAAERMRKQWQDPEWRAKREAGLAEAFARGTGHKNRSASMKAQWADPKKRKARLDAIKRGLDNGMREKRREIIKKAFGSPEVEEKRLRKLREKFASTPLRLKASAMMLARKKRGFDVPRHLKADYTFLRKKKHLSAREAGLVLGLVRP